MSNLTHPHDYFFRHAFTRTEVHRPFFERYLPPPVATRLDLNTLAPDSDTFIDEDLQAQQSDLLFRLHLKDGQPARLYLLLEHKSYNDPWTPRQLLGYLDRIWAREAVDPGTPPLPPIIPLVLFHGETAWTAASNFRALVATPDEFLRFTPSFDYILCDLTRDQLDNLQHRAWLAITLQVLKFSRSDELSARLPGILALFRDLWYQRANALAFLGTVLRYLARVASGLDESTVRQALIQALPTDVGDEIMPTLAETWMEQGMEKGMEKGQILHARQTLQKFLIKRFGPLPGAVEARIEQADQATLDSWLDQVMEAPSLGALFPDI